MTKKKLKILFELLEELYWQEQKKMGMITPMPYCWASQNEMGFLCVFSAFGKHSHDLAEKTGITLPEEF